MAHARPNDGWICAGGTIPWSFNHGSSICRVHGGLGNHAGNLSQINSAVLAAVVTTYSTFLPCFLFIFLGAPYIAILKGNRDLSGALSTITAAVVGVIMNLAIVLGLSVFWPHGLEGSFNGMALTLSIAAFVALYRLRLNILWVLLIGGLLGLALTFGD